MSAGQAKRRSAKANDAVLIVPPKVHRVFAVQRRYPSVVTRDAEPLAGGWPPPQVDAALDGVFIDLLEFISREVQVV